MKKVLSIAAVCIMVTLLASVTNVSALDLEQIQNTQWDTQVTSSWYDDTSGTWVKAGGGRSVTSIYPGDVDMVADLFDWAFYPQNLSLECEIVLSDYSYNPVTAELKSDGCHIQCLDVNGGSGSGYSGPCYTEIKFTTDSTFEGSITFTDASGRETSVTGITAKKLR